jgi:hypothetical protein
MTKTNQPLKKLTYHDKKPPNQAAYGDDQKHRKPEPKQNKNFFIE